MTRFKAVVGKSIANGYNVLWREEAFFALRYEIDKNEQLHFIDEDGHFASFARDCWMSVERVDRKEEQCKS